MESTETFRPAINVVSNPNVKKDALPKTSAVKKARASFSVQAVIRALNEAEDLRNLDTRSADGAPLTPLDWLPTTAVGGSQGRRRRRPEEDDLISMEPVSRLASRTPYDRAVSDLTKLGLSPQDLRLCKCCRLWFLSSSRKAEVCPDCRQKKYPTQYRRRHRAELAKLAGIKPRTSKKASR
jgi:hypothetical protein